MTLNISTILVSINFEFLLKNDMSTMEKLEEKFPNVFNDF